MNAPANIGGQAITPLNATTDQQAIVAQQQILIATQAQAVRDLETALNLAPPPPTTPPAPPGASVSLQTVITTQTAAIRTQAAYMQHLLDLQVALNPGP